MERFTLCILFFILFFKINYAQIAENFYSAYSIPPQLLKHAHAVVRQYDLNFTVIDKGTAIEREHKIVTILDEKGKDHSEPYFHYDKITEIDDIEAAVYDASGKLVRKMKKKDIDDFKPYEHVFVNDDRYKKINFSHMAYPYTVEYTVVSKHKGLMFYPVWRPQESASDAVQNASLEVKMPADLNLRFKELNMPAGSRNTGTYFWRVKNIPAFQREPFTSSKGFPFPMVMTAPTDFQIEGYEGNMNSWQNFGHFISKLNAGRSDLSEETKTMLRKLVADCPDTLCKIRKVYEYMQNTTRYYFVGLGIGGWQPFFAADVDRRKYGDCKALSNYMVSMLAAVDIQANYALIRAGDDEQERQYADFPNAYFNHAIACVPMKNDTLWLECTSQTESCGFLSTFTDNRNALMVTKEGGKFVRTTAYDETVNTVKKHIEIDFSKPVESAVTEGGAMVRMTGIFSGIKESLAHELAEINADTRKKYLYEHLNLNNFEIKDLTFKRNKARIPSVEQNMTLEVHNLASVSGKRLFIPVNLFSKLAHIPAPDSTRQFDFQPDSRGFTEIDSIHFILPEGYKVESQPAPLSIQSDFGSFAMSFSAEGNKVVAYRKFILNSKKQPKEKYNMLVDFLKNVAKADKSKLILVKT